MLEVDTVARIEALERRVRTLEARFTRQADAIANRFRALADDVEEDEVHLAERFDPRDEAEAE